MAKLNDGKEAELAVHRLLSGSTWMRGKGKGGKHYDVEWEGIKIDVKSTVNIGEKYVNFSLRGGSRHNGVVLVMAAQIDGLWCFWVDKYKAGVSGRRSIVEAISGRELSDEVLKVNSYKVDPVTPANSRAMVSYSFTPLDNESFEKIRMSFYKKHLVNLSMAEIIRLAMRYYGQRMKYIKEQDM